MKEDKIDPVPLVADAEPPLTPDKGERPAEFKEKGLELLDECLLKVAL